MEDGRACVHCLPAISGRNHDLERERVELRETAPFFFEILLRGEKFGLV